MNNNKCTIKLISKKWLISVYQLGIHQVQTKSYITYSIARLSLWKEKNKICIRISIDFYWSLYAIVIGKGLIVHYNLFKILFLILVLLVLRIIIFHGNMAITIRVHEIHRFLSSLIARIFREKAQLKCKQWLIYYHYVNWQYICSRHVYCITNFYVETRSPKISLSLLSK